jgi:hypothetical protein
MKTSVLFLTTFLALSSLFGQSVTIKVDANANRRVISPAIYGRNNNLSDDTSSPTLASAWQFYKEAGLKMLRESGGNNSTKYNWRKKLSSHPDWYNNVYAHDWDFAAQSLQENMPGAKGMWSFQLLGKVASQANHNFDDYAYNKSKWWSGTAQNLAGGGTPNAAGGASATVEGDTSLYLQYWPADSSVAILDQWFGKLGLDSTTFVYWNMDNEPEIWNGTHDDAVKTPMEVEDYIKRYVAIAQKAKQKYPGIKLVGPVFTNEWQWYAWDNDRIYDSISSKSYVWVEYFIKRIAEEQVRTGTRLLDVLDFHFYPNSDSMTTAQLHRVWFDSTYVFPGANGVKLTGKNGWDTRINKEYIFKRSTKWLDQYMGKGHGVNFGISEYGSVYNANPNVVAVWYASQLGTFASHNVEIFTPWDWYPGMWETLHLFSKYSLPISIGALSNKDSLVSAYASLNESNDSMTVILVNRDPHQTFNTQLVLQNFDLPDGSYPALTLSNLPKSETFVSHTQNALKPSLVTASTNQLSISLAPYSVTAIQVSTISSTNIQEDLLSGSFVFEVVPNPVSNLATLVISGSPSESELLLVDMMGKKIRTIHLAGGGNEAIQQQLDVTGLPNGVYHCILQTGSRQVTRKIVIAHSSN